MPYRYLLLIALILPAATAKSKIPKTGLDETQQAVHVLNRLAYGPRPGDVKALAESGVAAFIERQLHPESIDDSALEARLAPLVTIHMGPRELAELFPNPGLVRRMVERGLIDEADIPGRARMSGSMGGRGVNPMLWKIRELPEPIEVPGMMRRNALPIRGINPQQVVVGQLQAAKVLRSVYSERQLLEVMTDFWMNHFNVFMGKQQVRLLVPAYERDVIRPNALGNFRELLGGVAKSPAMLVYLDNVQSVAPDSPMGRRRGRGLNENYARELMELHTLGVDGGYTQADVTEAARVLTGWTAFGGPEFSKPGFRFLPPAHDQGVKTVMGHEFKAGYEEGEALLDMLAGHPSTASFIARKLVQRFVADEAPESLVEKVAASFGETDGDIRAMLRTIFYSKEFWAQENYQSKVKKPLDLVASSMRAVGAEWRLSPGPLGILDRMGEPLYMCQPPTGYPDEAQAWLGSDALLSRWNFAASLATGRLNGIEASEGSTSGTLDELSQRFLHAPLAANGSLSESAAQLGARRGETGILAALVLASPQFQRR